MNRDSASVVDSKNPAAPLRCATGVAGDRLLFLEFERFARHDDGPVLADVQQQSRGHVAGQQTASTIAHEGQGNAGDGH